MMNTTTSHYLGIVYTSGECTYYPGDSTTGQPFTSLDDLRRHLAGEGYPRVEFLPGDGDEYLDVVDVIDLGGKAERWLIAAERAEALRVELAAALAASDRHRVPASTQRRQAGGPAMWERITAGVNTPSPV